MHPAGRWTEDLDDFFPQGRHVGNQFAGWAVQVFLDSRHSQPFKKSMVPIFTFPSSSPIIVFQQGFNICLAIFESGPKHTLHHQPHPTSQGVLILGSKNPSKPRSITRRTERHRIH